MSRCIVIFQSSGVSRCIMIFQSSEVSHWIEIFKGAGSHAVPFIQVFWDVTLNRDIQGCWESRCTLYSSVLGCHIKSWYSRVLGSGSHAVPLYSSVLGCHAVSWNSSVVGCHAESWYSRVLVVTLYPDIQVFWDITLYRDIPVFWDVTLYRESSLLGCHAGSWNWTKCVYRTVQTISFKQPKLSLVLKIHVGFLVDKVAMRRVFLRGFRFSPVDNNAPNTYSYTCSCYQKGN